VLVDADQLPPVSFPVKAFFLCTLLLEIFIGIGWTENLALHPLLKDGAVLQRNVPLPVTGRAGPGAKVTIGWKGQSHAGSADASGKWSVLLPAGPAESQGQTLRVQSGKDSLTITNLLVGEVWLASGQSNMEWILKNCTVQSAEAAGAEDPQLRFVTIPRAVAEQPVEAVPVAWQSATPESVLKLSAVAYFFARDLRKELKVPVGIISSAYGGTPAESWTPEETLAADPRLSPALEKRKNYPAEYPKLLAEYEQKRPAYEASVAAAKAAGTKPPAKLNPPQPVGNNPYLATVLWNSMISPLLPCPIRGVIWYQGEANAKRAEKYEHLLGSMIEAWRNRWASRARESVRGLDRFRWWLHSWRASPDFPFLIVQLADFNNDPEGSAGTSWARLRDAQTAVADKVPRCGVAVTLGLGDAEDIHPQRKLEVGQRLAKLARKVAYGQNIPSSGPVLQNARSAGKEMEVTFQSVHGSLRTVDGAEPGSFSLSGKDGKFYPANARIEGLGVILSSPEVAEPIFVRYAWSNRPENPNLTDESGLPARPFRTDSDPKP
jgi:sialate O-acetylesterase